MSEDMHEEIKEQTEQQADINSNKEPESEPEQEEKSSSVIGDILDVIESVISSVFFVVLLFAFVCRPVTVDGRSMLPTLKDKDKLILISAFYTPEQGDIVVVNNEHSNTFVPGSETELGQGPGITPGPNDGNIKRIIKRVIAKGGQEINIDFEKGIVYVDGEALSESYINTPTYRDEGAFEYPFVIPEGYVFVMGDNRNDSADSRDTRVGLIKEEDVLGKVFVRVYPFDRFGFVD